MNFEFGQNKFEELDERIIRLIVNEKTNLEIADQVGYSLSSIKRRLRIIFRFYKVKTRAGLVREILKELDD